MKLDRLLTQDGLLADYPDVFAAAAMNAIEHIGRRDASYEVNATLTFLTMIRRWAHGHGDRNAELLWQRSRKWAAGLRRGHALLWLDERLHLLGGDDLGGAARWQGSDFPDAWRRSIARRISEDPALTRGVIRFLMGWRDPWAFARLNPLIEALLSSRNLGCFLWKLAGGKDPLLQGRAGMYLLDSTIGKA